MNCVFKKTLYIYIISTSRLKIKFYFNFFLSLFFFIFYSRDQRGKMAKFLDFRFKDARPSSIKYSIYLNCLILYFSVKFFFLILVINKNNMAQIQKRNFFLLYFYKIKNLKLIIY